MLSADSAAEAEPGSGAGSNGADGDAAMLNGSAGSEAAENSAGGEPDQDEEQEEPSAGEAVLYVSAEESVEQVRGAFKTSTPCACPLRRAWSRAEGPFEIHESCPCLVSDLLGTASLCCEPGQASLRALHPRRQACCLPYSGPCVSLLYSCTRRL